MILAFDLGLTTGVACGSPGSKPAAWTIKLPSEHSARFAELMRAVDRLVKERHPALIAIEMPFIQNKRAVASLYGLRGAALGIAGLHKLGTLEAEPKLIRKHFIGSAGGKREEAKARVMERCRQLGWGFRNDNESDALALWDWAASKTDAAHGRMTMRIFDGGR